MSWIEVKAVFDVAPEDWSPYIDIFDRHGLENTLQSDNPPYLSSAIVEVDSAQTVLSALTADLLAAGARHVETRPLVEENWEENWKQHFKPRRIGKRIVVRPTWEEFSAQPGDAVIVLDPGQAFGTGDHPTTRMCLELLEEAQPSGKRVADIGCGSGILAVAACLLVASSVDAVDIDPISVEVARENAVLNGVRFDAVAGEGVAAVQDKAPFDLVLSNIISAVLIMIAADIADVTAPGGTWILSGVIQQNWDDVRAAAEKAGFTLVRHMQEDDWVAASFTRTG